MQTNDTKNSFRPDPMRRRLFRGAAGGIGVLLTVQAKTALGNTANCISPSAKMSGNQSHQHDTSSCSGGRSPGFWVQPQHSQYWSPDYVFPTFDVQVEPCTSGVSDLQKANIINQGSLLSTFFTGAPSVGMWYALAFPTDTSTFGTQERGQLLRHLSAALLNAAEFSNYPITKLQVQEMWNELQNGGIYCPGPEVGGACGTNGMTRNEVVAYIEGMYGINSEVVNLCKKNP